jgi:hypothetical protein
VVKIREAGGRPEDLRFARFNKAVRGKSNWNKDEMAIAKP